MKKTIRETAAKRARQLTERLDREVQVMSRRAEAARATTMFPEGDGPMGACPFPHADFTDRLSKDTAAVDALIMLGAELEDGT